VLRSYSSPIDANGGTMEGCRMATTPVAYLRQERYGLPNPLPVEIDRRRASNDVLLSRDAARLRADAAATMVRAELYGREITAMIAVALMTLPGDGWHNAGGGA
jgi:hypothetical protein